MEIKSCSYNNRYYCVWQEDFGFAVEALRKKQKVVLRLQSLLWIEGELQKILEGPINIYFSKKIQIEQGFLRLAKFKTKEGWFADIAWWPTTEGRRSLHVQVGSNKQGWYVFQEMVSASLILANNQTLSKDLKGERSFNLNGIGPIKSYVEVVKETNKSDPYPRNQFLTNSYWVKRN